MLVFQLILFSNTETLKKILETLYLKFSQIKKKKEILRKKGNFEKKKKKEKSESNGGEKMFEDLNDPNFLEILNGEIKLMKIGEIELMKIGEIRRFAIDCSISFLIMLFHAPFYLSHLLVLIFAVDKPIWVNYFCFLILLNGLYQIIFGLNLLVVFFSFLPFLVLDFTLFPQSLDFILFPQKVDEWSLITLEISYLVIGFTIYSFLVPVVNLLRYTTEDKKNKITLCVDW